MTLLDFVLCLHKKIIPDRLISSEVQYETLLGFKSDCSGSCDTEWRVLSTEDSD